MSKDFPFPIEIDIEDNRIYAQIAQLVDSSLFLQDTISIRNYFDIQTVFKFDDYDSWNLHLHKLAGFNPHEAKVMYSLTDSFEDKNRFHKWLKDNEYESERLSELRKEFKMEVARTRETHRYPPIFDEVIEQAILFHRIGKFRTTKATMYLSLKPSVPDTKNEVDRTMAIIVTPFSTQKDVLEAFEECKRLRKEYEESNPLTVKLDADTASTVKRDRIWFWERYHEKKRYRQILDDWNNMCPNSKKHAEGESCEFCDLSDQNVIEQAVSRYKKRLQFLFEKP